MDHNDILNQEFLKRHSMDYNDVFNQEFRKRLSYIDELTKGDTKTSASPSPYDNAYKELASLDGDSTQYDPVYDAIKNLEKGGTDYEAVYKAMSDIGGDEVTKFDAVYDVIRKDQKDKGLVPTAPTPTVSENVSSAMQLLQELMKKQYADPYGQQLNKLIEDWNNREDFSYDLNADPLYLMARDNAVKEGNLAMRDTMGRASGMTGGYGNSYAQAVGQQAFDAYLQELNSQAPNYMNAAYQRYQDEASKELQEIALLQAQRDDDYAKWKDAYSREFSNISQMFDSEEAATKSLMDMINAENENNKWLTETIINAAAKGLDYDPETGISKATTMKTSLTNDEFDKAVQFYREGGSSELNAYIENLVSGGLDPDFAVKIKNQIKSANTDSIGAALDPYQGKNIPTILSLQNGLWSVDEENAGGVNWGGGINKNRKYINPFTGKSVSYKELKKMLMDEGLDESGADTYIKTYLYQNKK